MDTPQKDPSADHSQVAPFVALLVLLIAKVLALDATLQRAGVIVGRASRHNGCFVWAIEGQRRVGPSKPFASPN
jgi:hypothetical protein